MSIPFQTIEVCVENEQPTDDVLEVERRLKEAYEHMGVRVTRITDCGMCQYHPCIRVDGVTITKLSPDRLEVQFLNDPEHAINMGKRVNQIRTKELGDYLDQEFIL